MALREMGSSQLVSLWIVVLILYNKLLPINKKTEHLREGFKKKYGKLSTYYSVYLEKHHGS